MAKTLDQMNDEEIFNFVSGKTKPSSSSVDFEMMSTEDLEKIVSSKPTKPESGGFVKGAFESAPMTMGAAGAMVGGTAGAPFMGVGAIPGGLIGGSAGSALGSAIRSFGRKYVYDEPETRQEYYGNLGKETVMGLASEMGGQAAGKALGFVGKGLTGLFGSKPNAEVISESAKRLGTKATPGMTSNSPTMQGLESSLNQAPSLAGGVVRSETQPVREAIQKTVQNITGEGTSLTPFEVGEKVKAGLVSDVGEKTGPVSMLFETVKASTKDIPLSEKSIAAVSKNIKNIDEVRLLPKESWSSKANSYAEALQNAKSVDEIATIRKVVGQDMRAAQGNEKMVLSQIYDKISKLENNNLIRGAIKAGRTAKEGEKVGKELVQESLEARKLWKGLVTDLDKFSKVSGLNKKGITPILNAIEDVPAEKVSQKFFNTGNLESLNTLKKQFPDQFELLRQAKLAEIQKASLDAKGNINPSMFLRSIKSMGSEVQELVFGKGAKQTIQDLETVVKSLPDRMGPSGTPQGMQFLDMLNPYTQAMDLARLGVLKGQGPLRATGQALQSPVVQPSANVITRKLLELNQKKQGR